MYHWLQCTDIPMLVRYNLVTKNTSVECFRVISASNTFTLEGWWDVKKAWQKNQKRCVICRERHGSENSTVEQGDAEMNTLPPENLPGQTCESVPPLQQTERGHSHQSDSACNALPLRQTGLNETCPEPVRPQSISFWIKKNNNISKRQEQTDTDIITMTYFSSKKKLHNL